MVTVEFTRLPDEEYAGRLERVRAEMASRGKSLGLVYGNEFVPGDVQYLTGYDPQIEAAAVVITPERVAVLGGPEGQAMFEDQKSVGEWFNFQLFEVPYQDYGSLRFEALEEILAAVGASGTAEALLLTNPLYLPYELVARFEQHGLRCERAEEILSRARYEKSPLELQLFRTASSIATRAAEAMINGLEPGMTELELAALGDHAAKTAGAYSYGWDTMVLSGPRIKSIIGRASNKRIEEGEMVLIGACPRYAGYASTVGRTVVAGTHTPEQREFLQVGARALELAAENLVAGRPARYVDTVPRQHLEQEGYGKYHAYGVGHGIGFSECLEERTATKMSDYDLPAGISMSLDVGIFRNYSGFNGRFEDPYIIDHDGKTERLTDLPVLPVVQ